MSLNNGHISVLFRTYIGHFYRQLSVSSVFFHKSGKPQIHSPPLELSACYAKGCAGNADERRYVHVAGFGRTTHHKGRKECKSIQQESLRPLRSLWFNTFFTPAHERAPQPTVICG